jgi:FkbM family methyltransferase
MYIYIPTLPSYLPINHSKVPLFCPAQPESTATSQEHITTPGNRDLVTGACSSQDLKDFRLNSFDGSSYLRNSVSGMLADISSEHTRKISKSSDISPASILTVKDLWTYNHMAVSDKEGSVRFTKQAANQNPGFEGGRIRGAAEAGEIDGTELVPVITIDSFVKNERLKDPSFSLDVLKIDSEGNDNKVIDGAMETIKESVKLLTFEGGGGVTFSYDLSEQLDKMGFSCYSTSRAGLFKWNSECTVREYFGGLRQKDKGNIFCVNRIRLVD